MSNTSGEPWGFTLHHVLHHCPHSGKCFVCTVKFNMTCVVGLFDLRCSLIDGTSCCRRSSCSPAVSVCLNRLYLASRLSIFSSILDLTSLFDQVSFWTKIVDPWIPHDKQLTDPNTGWARNVEFVLQVVLEEIPCGQWSQKGLSLWQHECAQGISWHLLPYELSCVHCWIKWFEV